ncbi:MAG: polyphosphate kinase 1 [Planctomycetota bacterium]
MTLASSPDIDPLSAVPAEPGEADERFLNRETTWLEFNRRVLREALDERTPLLERCAFLAIFNSNLDEFFQKRVGGLKRQIDTGTATRSYDGKTPQEQLKAIREMVKPMLDQQAECFENEIRPALADQGVHLLTWPELTPTDRQRAVAYYRRNLFPVLTPLAVDPGHPFPFISNLSTSLGVMMRTPESQAIDPTTPRDPATAGVQFARVKVPAVLPGWIPLHSEDDAGELGYRFVSLEDLVRHNLGDLFEGMQIEAVEPFRITRNADVDREEEDAEDLLEMISQELRDRRFARVCRLEVDDDPHLPINQVLIQQLDLHEKDVYQMPGLLDYNPLWQLHKLNKPKLKYKPWTPVVPARLADDDTDFFSVIRTGDLMVHHPYESFGASVERFIAAAANDPAVVAIKLTLYRTADDSPFLPNLIKAAEAGKQVVCLVELKARFDEERNVQIARRLEKAGIHVVYGVVGLKTHTKTSLVVRQEHEGMRCYAHIGTGNYNAKTANLYTDLGLFTCDTRLTDDIVELFHFLTGRSQSRTFKHLLIAPVNMRKRFNELIDREIAHAQAWKDRGADPEDPNRPRITCKMNSLEDREICERLYAASQAGVAVELIVRGFCCLRPGVPGLSDNIRVISVIGRFLEHSRIYRFHNNGQPEHYIGSADWMYRNLSNRVECITPLFEPDLKSRLDEILAIVMNDPRQAWDMHADGTYTQRRPQGADDGQELSIGTHRLLMALAKRESSGLPMGG